MGTKKTAQEEETSGKSHVSI